MNRIITLGAITVIIAVVAIALSAKANKLSLNQCVTIDIFKISEEHYYNYIFAARLNSQIEGYQLDQILLPQSITQFYVPVLDCLQTNQAFGVGESYDKEIKQLRSLPLVEDV